MTGIERIAAERKRQIGVEGWTAEHDSRHLIGELARAAACYALHASGERRVFAFWPWGNEWWKPSKNQIRDLEKAGALIAAEIDRLQMENE